MSALLLTDATMPVSFCKAGIGSARVMAAHLGPRVHMVEDVHLELQRLAASLPALETLLEDWPPNPVRELGLDLKARVAQVIRARQIPGHHPDEDRGELATIFYAAQRREAGEAFEVITDDRFGKQLARDRGLGLVTTPQLVIELVTAGQLPKKEGERVWRYCTPRKAWSRFHEEVGGLTGAKR
ncbi:MAG TPA: hypothetical protein VK889_03785 [Solirubrobacterales bacterium]|nr:hypothetical protein [Solirubrobacterales bacterium]